MRHVRRIVIVSLVVTALTILVLTASLPITQSDPDPSERDQMGFGGSGIVNSNRYIKEFIIPTPASRPVGITVDNNGMIWFSETRIAKIGKFNPVDETFEEFRIPVTDPVADAPEIWGMMFDSSKNLWFTDSTNNLIWKFNLENKKFEKYMIPTEDSFPIQLAIDYEGTVWFTEVYGNKLGQLRPSETRDGTTDGITEFIPPGRLEMLGGLTIDIDGNIWLSMLTYPFTGKIVKYSPRTAEFEVFVLPNETRSPVGVSVDNLGVIWISDHGTSLFASFNTSNKNYEVYVTSTSGTSFPTTLPYWSQVDSNGRIWFNEHQGNAISVFDSQIGVLTEYAIPTRNPIWGNTSNPLQIAVAPDGRVWFTEWTENKIGVVDTTLEIPFNIQVSSRDLELQAGQEIELEVSVQSNIPLRGIMDFKVSGTFMATGKLQNISATFESETVMIENEDSYVQRLRIKGDKNLIPGKYTVMVGVSFEEITRLVPVVVRVSE